MKVMDRYEIWHMISEKVLHPLSMITSLGMHIKA